MSPVKKDFTYVDDVWQLEEENIRISWKQANCAGDLITLGHVRFTVNGIQIGSTHLVHLSGQALVKALEAGKKGGIPELPPNLVQDPRMK